MMPWYLAPSLERLWGQVRATFSNRNTAADGSIGDLDHQGTVSDHNPDPKTGVVRALDVTVTKAQSKRVLDAVVGDPRVAYVIYDRRIWTPGAGWRDYHGVNPHAGHIHTSLKHDKKAEDDRTNWKGLEVPTMYPLIGPGYVSSAFGLRGGFLHAGADYAPNSRKYGEPVYATYGGMVEKVVSNRVHDRSAAQTKNKGKAQLAPGRTGNGPAIRNPDGELQRYIHVKPAVKKGQKVKPGDVIGHIDDSGNTSGPHVHFEIEGKDGKVRNPQGDFAYHGVDPFGAKKPSPAPKPPAPAPTPTPTPTPKAPSRAVQAALRAMGLPPTLEGVKRYQRDHGLVPDGDWGNVTETYYQWVKSLQRALNQWKTTQRPGLLPITGYRGTLTARAEREVVKPPLNRKVFGTTKASMFKGLGIKPEPPKRG